MSASAFKGTYSDWRLVKTRGVVQIIVEVPLAEADAAYEILGGMPDPAHERWVALAALQEGPPRQIESMRTAGAKPWRDMLPQAQAGMRCEEAAFVHFLREERPDDWHETQDTADCVRLICGVKSRKELGTNHAARVIWKQLDDQYIAWKALERA